MSSSDAVVGSDVELVELILFEVELESRSKNDLGAADRTIEKDDLERQRGHSGLVDRVAADFS